MFRPWLRVAIPDDWTGSVARLGSGLLVLAVLLGPLLGRVPEAWVVLAGGQRWLVRVAMLLVVAWLLMQLRPLAYLPLPRTIVLLGRRVRVPGPLHSRWIKVEEIETIHVDERAEGEAFTLAMRSGLELELCPVDWKGAPRLYVKLNARVKRARKRRLRLRLKQKKRAARRGPKVKPVTDNAVDAASSGSGVSSPS